MTEYFAKHDIQSQKLIKIETVEPVLASDSFEILYKLFTARKDTVKLHLQRGYEYAKLAYKQAKEGYETTEFPVLKPSFKETMDQAAIEMEKAQTLLKIVDTDCKGTNLEKDYLLIEHYKKLGKELLGYKLSCNVRNNSSEEKRFFFLDKSRKKVVLELIYTK